MDQNKNTFPIVLKCECLDHEIENNRTYYGRFAIYPFLSGQAITIGTAIRRTLLGEIESTCITSAYVVGATHEYSSLHGIRESVHDIILNLKEIVFKGNSKSGAQIQKGFISFQGPGIVTSEHIKLPSIISVVDKTQYIARLETSTQLEIHLTIEKQGKYNLHKQKQVQESTFLVDSILKPVRNVNYSIHSLGDSQVLHELLILEIWTNGSLTPHEALYHSSCSLTLLFQNIFHLTNQEHNINIEKPNFTNAIVDSNYSGESHVGRINTNTNDSTTPSILKKTSIDELQIPVRASNCLKKADILTVFELLKYTQEDLLKIKNLGKRSAEHILKALKERFGRTLPKT
uniref:DNA-directed RNA polymerase subunit alpha n=1 Tax=Cylindrocystis brebissonii TaxID=102167 RepID=A0A191T658_9VIRI|nr:alpha subunit of RNA polymerase [Cylindrocystis brebissonii]ANI25886.1 alpha subunit of RNA polymerase [Cylindrocystis brebissonii]